MKKIAVWLIVLGMLTVQGVCFAEDNLAEKAENGIKKGAEAAERGIEKGADAAEKGVKKWLKATGKGLKKAGDWVENKTEKASE